MSEKAIKDELRLFALESIVCQHLATVYQQMPPEIFDAVRKQAVEDARKQTFAGADAAQSDLFSGELEIALDRLYGMINHHLEKNRKRRSSKP
jgi:hypothetical protein